MLGKLLLWLIVKTQTAAWEVFHASVAEDAFKEAATHGDAILEQAGVVSCREHVFHRSWAPVGSPE